MGTVNGGHRGPDRANRTPKTSRSRAETGVLPGRRRGTSRAPQKGMRMFRPRSLMLAFAFATMSVVLPAHADTADPEAAGIVAAGHTLEWNWTPPGHSDRFGHGETLIHAPLAAVRRVVLDFSRYKELPPNSIKTSRVIGHATDGSTDVYFQIGVLNDIMTFWNVTRFAPLKHSPDGVEVVEGRMLPGKGNVDDAALMWTMRGVGT